MWDLFECTINGAGSAGSKSIQKIISAELS